MRTLAAAALGLALVAAAAAPARADDSVRCGEWVVSLGASEGEVWHKCGAPTETYTDTEYVTGSDGIAVAYTIDRWIYNRGPYEFMRTLSFRGGSLVCVHVGGRGY